MTIIILSILNLSSPSSICRAEEESCYQYIFRHKKRLLKHLFNSYEQTREEITLNFGLKDVIFYGNYRFQILL